MIRRPTEEILVAYSTQDLEDLLGGEDFIILPDGEGHSKLYLFLDAEGGVSILDQLSSLLESKVSDGDYLIVTLGGTIEEASALLSNVSFIYPECS